MKKAYLAKVDLLVRVIVDDHIDPEGEEFGEIVYNATNKRMKEEGISFINEGIDDYEEDIENPYDPDYDD
jgi:hypothetical protein